MVGQRLKNYIQSWGLAAEDAPKVVTAFVGAKYVTLGGFIALGTRYQPLRRLFPRKMKAQSLSFVERVKKRLSRFSRRRHLEEEEERLLRQKWGGWYMWTSDKYWHLADGLRESSQKSLIMSALSRHLGADTSRLALGLAEGVLLCKATFIVWAPLELCVIVNFFKSRRKSGAVEGDLETEDNFLEQYSQAVAAAEDVQEMSSGPI
eukprot:TRINITY_DN33260_c0_g1_i1.p1 TRINITY_DN33260_c0_g1~~TRINITY_DN33260_c0_g1_i1.p1  ORF type:complete len:206 (-),score=34.85 TRINITY_DN33260_c0_g1_i1:215-832(-)